MMNSVLIIGALIVYLSSEKSYVHFSRTARRAFWYFLSCAVVLTVVRWLQTLGGMGMFWVIVSAVLAASVVEDEVSKARGLVLMDNEASRRQRSTLRSPAAQGLAERIMDLVAAITRGMGYTAGTAQLLSRVRGTTRKLRKGLLAALAGAGAEELNYVLAAVNVPALLEVSGLETIRLLTQHRVHELTVVSRATIVDAFQKLGLRYRPERQAPVRDVFLATRGFALTQLKAYIDDGGDYHSCYKLMYNDLQGAVREQVLAHVTREGLRVAKAFRARVGPEGPPGAVLKVLSDVDDTLFSSGGAWPAGVDVRYPRKCFYPGAFAFYAELDRSFAARYRGVVEELDAELRAEDGEPKSSPFAFPQRENHRLAVVDERGSHADDEVESRAIGVGASPPSTPRGSPTRKKASLPTTPFLSSSTTGNFARPDVARAQLPPRAPLVNANVTSPARAALPPLHIPPWARDETSALLSPNASGSSPLYYEGDGSGHVLNVLATDPRSPLPGEAHDPLLRVPSFHLAAAGGLPARTHQEGSNLVFLSARPESYKGMTEAEAHRRYFGPAVARHELDTNPSMLLGSLDSGPRALLSYLRLMSPPQEVLATAPASAAAAVAMAQMLAAKKLSRAREYAAIYPEAALVLVGDNGQGDVLTSEVLWSSLRPKAEAAQAKAADDEKEGGDSRRRQNPPSPSSTPVEGEGESLTPQRSAEGDPVEGCGSSDTTGVVAGFEEQEVRSASTTDIDTATNGVSLVDPAKNERDVESLVKDAAADAPLVMSAEQPLSHSVTDDTTQPTVQANKPSSRLMACFIHRVAPLANTFSMLSSKPGRDGGPPRTAETLQRWSERDIFFLNTHVGMAAQAYSLGLLDLSALHRVASTARCDFLRIWARYGHRASGRNLPEALNQLNEDIHRANQLLPIGLQVDPLEWPGERDGRGYARQPSDIARNPSPAVSDISTRLAVAQ